MGPGKTRASVRQAVETQSVDFVRELLHDKNDTTSKNPRGNTVLGTSVLQEPVRIFFPPGCEITCPLLLILPSYLGYCC